MRRGFVSDTRGAATAEFVLWLAVIIVPFLSVIDLGVFAFQRMQLEIAGQAAAQAVWGSCDMTKSPTRLPATRNCASLLSTITTAAQATSLGTSVTVPAGSPVEGYYCTNGSNALVVVGATGTIAAPLTATRPNCSTVTPGSTTPAGDYIQVTVNYPYTPVFAGVSLASLLPSTITRTAWMRLR
ncbi:MAG: TadE/TadG family type IV pilus assembly protein [Phenylobacterium sp.]